MRRQTQDGVSIRAEKLIKDGLRAQVLRSRGLGCGLSEEKIEFREARLDCISREICFDVGEIGTGVTSVDINPFAEEFFHFRNERVFCWEVETAE